MKKTIEQKRLEFLDETIAYYSADVSRRNAVGGSCRYSPLHDNTEGCAIGRYLSRSLAIQFDDFCGAAVSYSGVFNRLPKKLQILGQEFLRQVQFLHDDDAYWSTDGLSDEGKTFVGLIKKEHCQTDKKD